MKQKISVRAIVKQDDQTLLVRRGAGRASILGKYELPGGSLDFGEQPQDTLRRFLKDNLDGEIETAQLFDVLSFIDPEDSETQYVCIVYLVSLKNIKLFAKGRYDKYEWKVKQNLQLNSLTSSTLLLLELTTNKPGLPINSMSNNINDVKNTSKKTIIYSDGGSRGNPGPSASAFVIMDNNEQPLTTGGTYLGITTNNQAEYQAVYQALKRAQELQLKNIDFRLDSNLVVNQLNELYKIKNRDLWPIYQNIKKMMASFDSITFTHIGREFNHIADKLVNELLDKQQSPAR